MGAGDCTEMYIVVIDCFARSLFAMTAKLPLIAMTD
jgi:hypothetical protein